MWLDKVKKAYGDNLNITWKNFSLEQNAHNLKEGLDSNWKVWEQEDASERRSLVSQIAAEAARRQGEDAHAKFHLALLVARHGGEGRISLSDEDAILELAESLGLDSAQMREDMKDPELRRKIGEEHEAAISEGIFGTPTYVFENGNMAYLKAFIPDDEDAVASFEHYIALANHRNYFGEIKRPQPPWPKGVLG
ncbi:MAG: hypothetical protein F4X57_09780 [Chloroflexi bacterium]|nr:hypothetical protein [Chloroflexota bacterium]